MNLRNIVSYQCISRRHLQPDQALELNRKFQTYLQAFGDTQQIAKVISEQLA
jgi:hypothetical protein